MQRLGFAQELPARITRHDRAIGRAECALRCSPFDSTRHLAFAAVARAELFLGNTEAPYSRHGAPCRQALAIYLLTVASALAGSNPRACRFRSPLNTGFTNVRRANFSAHVTFEQFIAELAATGITE